MRQQRQKDVQQLAPAGERRQAARPHVAAVAFDASASDAIQHLRARARASLEQRVQPRSFVERRAAEVSRAR